MAAKSSNSGHARVFSVPFRKDDNFVGHEEIISEIDDRIG